MSGEEDLELPVFSLWEFETTGCQDYIHALEATEVWGKEVFVSAAF